MADKRYYFLVENINMSPAQRDAFVDLIYGDCVGNNSNRPEWRLQPRERPDGEAWIIEGLFPEFNIGRIVSMQAQAGLQGAGRAQPQPASPYGSEYIFQNNAPPWTDAYRYILFGGASATPEESGDAARQYLIDNRAEWESEIP